MTSSEIRDSFLKFFESKQHKIVPSAPLVVKNDPTLMFTNAGMNQFKDIFLGNAPAQYKRIADSQKCLRVSGKHNDLEEVGYDGYHHTLFEMLGNWSFGDYFKEDAIAWAWEFLTVTLKIEKNNLYVTVFEGSKEDGLDPDNEAREIWKKFVTEDKIIYGNKKDNFWEMGETGPCGPCSEIHIDLRTEDAKKALAGRNLVNASHPEVIEIWNNVFIQYNRKADRSLELLPDKHVDTGMGFERLCMVMQGKTSSYETDVFQPIIQKIALTSNKSYGKEEMTDIAMRVIADHLRAISFAITDGEVPSNTGAGYVIRRILRRAVRYGYTYLNQTEPFICKVFSALINTMGNAYPELINCKDFIEKVIYEEELTFLRTLETGIKLLDNIIKECNSKGSKTVDGETAFKLYDTFGFPLDLTELILREQGLSVNIEQFNNEMLNQKSRSRQAAVVETLDWVKVRENEAVTFVGYDGLDAEINITRYRKVSSKGKEMYHLVFDKTPFYAESGGQVGDTGFIETNGDKTFIIDTQKENNLIIHICNELPKDVKSTYKAVVNSEDRINTQCNHSATHLMHAALREVLGTHVEQKGSLVNPNYLRFDFSHYQKMNAEDIRKVENIVNQKIRHNDILNETREMPIDDARKLGAMALFGEKYGEKVRVIKLGDSVELCGGTHVKASGQIGAFKILSEGAISAGIRRIEAVAGVKAEAYINEKLDTLNCINTIFKNPKELTKSVQNVLDENQVLRKQIELLLKDRNKIIKAELVQKIKTINGIQVIAEKIAIDSALSIKDLAFQLKSEHTNLFFVIAAEIDGKASISVMITEDLIKNKGLNAGVIIKEISKEINGSGGGQAFYASAGGTNINGFDLAIKKAIGFLN